MPQFSIQEPAKEGDRASLSEKTRDGRSPGPEAGSFTRVTRAYTCICSLGVGIVGYRIWEFPKIGDPNIVP